jgi:hypothetical protein
MSLAKAVEGARHTAQQITWTDEDGTAVNLTGSTITGYKKANSDGTISALDGALALVTPASGIFSWTYGATDVGTVGTYKVQFIATYGDSTKDKSLAYDWEVIDGYDV